MTSRAITRGLLSLRMDTHTHTHEEVTCSALPWRNHHTCSRIEMILVDHFVKTSAKHPGSSCFPNHLETCVFQSQHQDLNAHLVFVLFLHHIAPPKSAPGGPGTGQRVAQVAHQLSGPWISGDPTGVVGIMSGRPSGRISFRRPEWLTF